MNIKTYFLYKQTMWYYLLFVSVVILILTKPKKNTFYGYFLFRHKCNFINFGFFRIVVFNGVYVGILNNWIKIIKD